MSIGVTTIMTIVVTMTQRSTSLFSVCPFSNITFATVLVSRRHGITTKVAMSGHVMPERQENYD